MQLELPLSQPQNEQPSPEDVAVLVAAELLVPVLGYSDPCERA